MVAEIRIFVVEHFSGGGVAGEFTTSPLVDEGRAMAAAIIADLASLSGLRVVTTHDERWGPCCRGDRVISHAVGTLSKSAIAALGAGCDGALVIAPETGGELADWRAAIEASGLRWLGAEGAAIDATGDKKRAADALARAGVRSVSAELLEGPASACTIVVVKPRWGAGSVETRLHAPRSAIPFAADRIVTPFVDGEPASVLALAGRSSIRFCVPCSQRIADGDVLEYEGGAAPLDDHRARATVDAARAAIACFPGLRGFVGVDVIVPRDAGADAIVVEINPRLVTSYAGIRRLAERGAVARAWLDIWLDGEPGPIPWCADRRVSFTAGGAVDERRRQPVEPSR